MAGNRTIPVDPEPVAAPDWDHLSADIECPLCRYNLRGLVQPRCPECGYAFDWLDLLDVSRRKHPYLFEHHPNQNIWSFFKTLGGGLLPKRFWKQLKPSQPGDASRLVLYWCCSILLVGWIVVLAFAWHTYQIDTIARRQRNAGLRQLQALVASQGPSALRGYSSTQAAIDANYPVFPQGRFMKIAISDFMAQPWNSRFGARWGFSGWLPLEGMGTAVVKATMLYSLWPWLTFAVLMIFQGSMRRAKVQPIHVARTVLYSCDAAWLLVLLCGVWLPYLTPRRFLWQFDETRLILLCALVIAVFTAWRLSRAYQHYLQFDRPVWTVVSAQVITLLVVMVACAWWLDELN